MPVSYDKLWKLLIDRKMNRTDLKDTAGVSYNIIAKMEKTSLFPWIAFIKYVLP